MENENENEQEQLAVDVGAFVQMILDRQAQFEASINKRIAKTDELQAICAEQQIALRQAVDTLQALVEGKQKQWERNLPNAAKDKPVN